MKRNFARYVYATAIAAGMLALSAPASAQAVITNGTIALGVDTRGQLNVQDRTGAVVTENAGGYVGVARLMDGDGNGSLEWLDSTSPGCLCEGWGVSVNGTTSGYANNDSGVSNISAVSFASTATTVTVGTELTSLPGLDILHEYKPSASVDLFQAVVTITNNTGSDVANLRYRRVMDWDIAPTEFSEAVTLQGWAAPGVPLGNLIDSCDDGFEAGDPLSDCSPIYAPEDANFVDNTPAGDHGASFTFDFGSLLAGASRTFTIYYGGAATEAAAFAALAAVGAEGIYSFGQHEGDVTGGTPATFIFGFGGVGAPPIDPTVPEPASLLLVGAGLVGGLYRRFRKIA